MSRGHGSLTQAMTLAGIELGEQADEEDAMPVPRLVLGYSSPFSDRSVTNSFAGGAPKPYDRQGTSRGTVSANTYNPDSIGNRFSRYGLPFSPDSFNNAYGVGNLLPHDSPTDPYGPGWRSEGRRQKF